jgi:hypothetical protein
VTDARHSRCPSTSTAKSQDAGQINISKRNYKGNKYNEEQGDYVLAWLKPKRLATTDYERENHSD